MAGLTGAPEIDGDVLSMLIAGTLTELVLPARSRAVPDTTWFLPSAVRITSAGQPAAGSMPDRSSAQLKWMVTFRLYQPLALGAAGETV